MRELQLQCKDQDQVLVEIQDQSRSLTLSFLQITLLLSSSNSNHSSSNSRHNTKTNSTPSNQAQEEAKGIIRTSSNNNMVSHRNINSHLNIQQSKIGSNSLSCRDLPSNLNTEDMLNMSNNKLNSRVLLSLYKIKTMVLDNSYQALRTQFSQLQMLCWVIREQEPLREKDK